MACFLPFKPAMLISYDFSPPNAMEMRTLACFLPDDYSFALCCDYRLVTQQYNMQATNMRA